MCHSFKSWDVRLLSPTEFAVEIFNRGPIIRCMQQNEAGPSPITDSQSPPKNHISPDITRRTTIPARALLPHVDFWHLAWGRV